MYRHFLDVALSDLKEFPDTSGRGNLLPILQEKNNNWRSENVPSELVELVKKVYTDDLTQLDCACLFWYVRNSLYFYQELDRRSDVSLWKYENLMHAPQAHFEKLSNSIGFNFTNYPFSEVFSTASIRKQRCQSINKRVRDLCQELLDRLDRHSCF